MVHKISVVFFLYIFFVTLFNTALQAQKSELLLVQLIYRHGDRTPLGPYPSDPFGDPSYWPNGFAQLTNRGKQQQFALGQWLRNRYKGFLPEKYSVNDIYVQSSDYDRTLMSAEANLAGLYVPNDTDIWEPDIKWQPIPVHTLRQQDDAILACKKNCPRYHVELKKVSSLPEVVTVNEEMQPLLKYLSNNTNTTVDSKILNRIYDNLYIQSLYNYKLPHWANDVFPGHMKRWFDWSFKINAYTTVLQRFQVGLLLNEIMERFVNKTKHELDPNRKMWIYSAHDSNVANLLNAFGLFEDPVCPPYTSTILLELSSNNGVYYVSAFYKNDTEVHPVSILDCELSCPLEKLATLLEPVLINSEQWETECHTIPVPMALTIVAITGIACGAALLLILVSFCCCRKYLPQKNYFD